MRTDFIVKMWSILLLAVASSAEDKKCPRFTCSSSVTDQCLKAEHDSVIYSFCPPTYSCPDFELARPQNVYCRRSIEEPPVSHGCPKYLDLNEHCTVSKPCHPDYYCRYDRDLYKGICMARREMGEYCSQVEECTVGNICNQGICIQQLSLENSEKADHALACKSGVISIASCGNPSKTIGAPGKECKNDQDCTASDGAPGECACSPTLAGRSFCKYNKSDPPVIEALQYKFNGYLARAKLKMYQAISYPTIAYAEDCLAGDAHELLYERMLIEVADECGAVEIVAAILLTLSFLLI